MTRAEAIEILKKHHMWTGEPSEVVDVRLENKALQMAIDALEVDEAYQLEYERTTKNDLGVDCISRQAVLDLINADWKYENLEMEINNLPSVTPQEPQSFKWCTDCKEYDQEKHCCHRWSKTIRDTVEEMKQEYIEREVLDKIRAEMFEEMISHSGTGEEVIQAYVDGLKKGLEILDKYKEETEVDNGNNNH